MPQPTDARLLLWPGRMLYVGPAEPTGLHAHHALQLTVCLEGAFELRHHPKGRWTPHEAVWIGSEVPHAFRGKGRIALLSLDPDSVEGRQIRSLLPSSGVQALTPEEIHAAPPGSGEWESWIDQVIARFAGQAPSPTPLHPAVRRARAFLDATQGKTPRLSEVSEAARLSPGRLVHLFTAQVGLPIRRYVLWKRLQVAGRLALEGASLTEAAHAAGFSDAAHLSRTFRRMFGLTPSSVVEWSQFVQVGGTLRKRR